MINILNNCGMGAPGANATQQVSVNGSTTTKYVTNVTARIENEFKQEENTFCGTTLFDLLNMEIEKTPMIFGDYILKEGLMAIVGSSDVGKSLLARQLGMAIAGKGNFLGWSNKCEHYKIAYISTEDDENATANIVRKANKLLKINTEDSTNMFFEFFPLEIPTQLNNFLQKTPVDVVVIDVFEDLFDDTDPNNSSNIRHIIKRYKHIAHIHKCLIVFVHHTNKYTESLAPSKDNASGSHAFVASMRLVFELKIDLKDTDKFHLCIVKGNYISNEEKRSSFVLKRDEYLVYHNTGERVPFEELASNAEGEKSMIKAKNTPKDFGDLLHLALIKENFSNASFSKENVNKIIQSAFGVSDKKSRSFTDFYIEKGWLVRTKESKQPKYRINAALMQ